VKLKATEVWGLKRSEYIGFLTKNGIHSRTVAMCEDSDRSKSH